MVENIDLPENGDYAHHGNGGTYLDIPFRIAKKKIVEEFEKEYISHLLELSSGNILKASKRSEMDYKSFYEKIKLHNIEPNMFKKPS